MLLGAAQTLLETCSADAISLADVAEVSSIPLTSIYNFFPNKHALLEALALHFHQQLLTHMQAHSVDDFPGWQALVSYHLNEAARFHMANVSMIKLFLGPGITTEVKNADIVGNNALAQKYCAILQKRFLLAVDDRLEKQITIALAIADSVWALSFCKLGYISDELKLEGIKGATAYLRLYLSELLVKRS